MKFDIKNLLRRSGVRFFETDKLVDILSKVDVLYMTRVAREYFERERKSTRK